jgi:hypothetical protein
MRSIRFMLIFTLLQTGCLELDEEHCLANGGDLACPGQRCLIQTNADKETMSDELGCSYVDENAAYHLHLTYGLPANFRISDGHRNMDTVEGILTAWRDEEGLSSSCSLDGKTGELGEASDILFDEYGEQIYFLRMILEDRVRVRTNRVGLYVEHRDAVHAYNTAMKDWLDACAAETALEGTVDES